MNDAEQSRLIQATALLEQACLMLESSEDPLLSVTGALASCAAEAAGAVAQGDADRAQVALSCARGSVVAATYLVRRLADAHKMTLPQAGSYARV